MKRQYDMIDVMKYVSALLVICIHTAPLVQVSPGLNFVLVQIVARTAVPFYFAASGFFLFKKIMGESKEKRLPILKDYSLRILKLYGVWTLLYLPLIILNANNSGNLLNVIYYLRNIFLNGTMYHLWFLPALVLGIWITYFLIETFKIKTATVIAFVIYLIGMVINVYGLALETMPLFKGSYSVYIQIFETSRNGIFFAPIFLCIGALIPQLSRLKNKVVFIGTLVSVLLLCFEAQIIQRNGFMLELTSMYFMLIPFTFFFLQSLMRFKVKIPRAKVLRSMSTLVYVGHIWVVFLLGLFLSNNLFVGILSIILSTVIAFIISKFSEVFPILNNLY